MSDPQESWTAPAPPLPALAPARRRTRRLFLTSGVAIAALAVIAAWLLIDDSSEISQQTAYDHVNKATQSLVTMLGQDPAQHPTFAYVSHCDNGAGGYDGWSVGGSSSMQAVSPEQAATLGTRLEAALRNAGYSDVKLTIAESGVDVRGHNDDAQVYLNYHPADTKDLLQFGATTDCDVAVGPHDVDHDAGYPLTDDRGHLLPSPGTGSGT